MSQAWIPLPYMERAVQHLVERGRSGLFLKPGMRKSSIMLAAYLILKEMKMLDKLLILAPLRVCYTTWPNEIQKWDEFKHLSIGILHGPKKNEVLREKHDIYVMNYEGLVWLSGELQKLKKWPFDGLVVDESTRMKETNTQRFKTIKPLLKQFKRRYILTGSPTANGLMNLFGQCYVMDSGETFGPYITRFREEFFYPTGFGGYDWTPKAGSEDLIHARLAPRVYYAHDEDYLQLPELIEKDIEVELPPKAMAMYLQMESALRLVFDSGKATAANTAVAAMKTRQLANGGIYLDNAERTWENIHDAKTEAVVDLVEELSGQPTLITYDFLHDLERLKKALTKGGKAPPHIGKGGVSSSQLSALIKSWNKGEVPVIIVNPQSMSHGVDGLQEAGRAIIWHSLTYSLENYDQLIARLRRSGQTERVLVAHIIAKSTIDKVIMTAIRTKDKKQRSLFAALKSYWD